MEAMPQSTPPDRPHPVNTIARNYEGGALFKEIEAEFTTLTGATLAVLTLRAEEGQEVSKRDLIARARPT